MSIVFLKSFLLCIILKLIIASETNRTYLVKKDFISGMKSGEFTVYDHLGKVIQYRLESKIGLTHQIRLFEGSSKTLLATLNGKITPAMYKATVSILSKNKNQWKNGTIEQNYKIVGNKFTIQFNDDKLMMETDPFSLDTKFIAKQSNATLAKFHKRVSSLFWRNKYDLQVLSDKYPDELYLLGIASKDHTNKKIHRG